MGKSFYCMMLLGIVMSCNLHNNRQTPQNRPDLLEGATKTIQDFSHEKTGTALSGKPYGNTLKDSFYLAAIRNDFPEMKNIFNKAETERQLLKTQNSRLKICLFAIIILCIGSLSALTLYIRRKICKTKQLRLSDSIKHSQWGFLVTKIFITENHIAYDELERTLNRAKGMNDINTEFYNKFHNLITRQKANYSGRLFNHLTTSNGNFETKFQQQFPNLSIDDFLLANMIHHRWENSDMASILHLSQDALRKRKTRLSHKISTYLKKDIELDEYLTHF